MESKIIKRLKNPFLGREEYVIEISSDSNPGFGDVKKIIGKDENLVVVKKINNNFGRKVFIAEVFVYDSQEEKDKVEKIPRAQKKKAEAVPAPVAQAITETPKEEVKEEKEEVKEEVKE